MDIVTKEKRSRNMAAIKSKDTKPEVYIRKRLFSLGYRYRKNTSAIIGHPDLWLKKYRTAIFINGCFWHRHSGCKYAYTPKSRLAFWESKFEHNVKRDQIVHQELKQKNIKCLVIWECTIKAMRRDPEKENMVLSQIQSFLQNGELYQEI